MAFGKGIELNFGMLYEELKCTNIKSVKEIKQLIPENLNSKNIEEQEYILNISRRIYALLEDKIIDDTDKKILTSFKVKIIHAESNLETMKNKEKASILKPSFSR